MTDALTNAERLLRENCWGIPRCVVGISAKDCEMCAAADALAAERERRGEPEKPNEALLAAIVESVMQDDFCMSELVAHRAVTTATEDDRRDVVRAIVWHTAGALAKVAAPPLPPATGEGERNAAHALGFRDGYEAAKRKFATPEPSEAMVEAAMNVPDHKALYHDLLYAVVNKWPNETRHQTALRYIREREEQLGAALAAQEGDVVARAVQGLEATEDAATVVLPCLRCEQTETGMVAFVDGETLERKLRAALAAQEAVK